MDVQPGKWQSIRTDAGYHLALVGANGEEVLWSENYEDEASIQTAINVAVRTVLSDQAEGALQGHGIAVPFVDKRTVRG